MSLTDRLFALDRFQQRRPRLSFLAAIVKKYGDDNAQHLGALIAFYAFFSLFPLLLVFVTVLGFILEGNPSAQENVLHSTLKQVPILGEQLERNVYSLTGSPVGLAIGIVGSLLAGLGITGATQSAFNQIWHIPYRRRPDFVAWRLRGLGLLLLLGLLSIVSTAAAAYVTAQTAGVVEVLGGILLALGGILLAPVVNLLLFFAAFRLLISEEVDTGDLVPGMIVGAVLLQILQHVGGYYVDHVLRHTKQTSGLFECLDCSHGSTWEVRSPCWRRRQRRARQAFVATQLLLGPPARCRQARTHRLRRGRGAHPGGERRGQLRGTREGRLSSTTTVPST